MGDPNKTTPITARPQYWFREWKFIVRDVRFLAKRLEERLVASRMAISFLQEEKSAQHGGNAEPLILPLGLKRLSINEMVEFVMEDAEESDANNVKRRYWAPSGPVVHLAAAMPIIGQEQRKQGRPLALERVLLDQALIEEITDAVGATGLIAPDELRASLRQSLDALLAAATTRREAAGEPSG